MRRTYAYNSIYFGLLFGAAIGVVTKSVVLGIVSGIIITVILFMLIRVIENAISKKTDKLVSSITRKLDEKHLNKVQTQQAADNVQSQQTADNVQSQQPVNDVQTQQSASTEVIDCKWVCPKCGTKLDKECLFCPNCGNEVANNSNQQLTEQNEAVVKESLNAGYDSNKKISTRSLPPALKCAIAIFALLIVVGGILLVRKITKNVRYTNAITSATECLDRNSEELLYHAVFERKYGIGGALTPYANEDIYNAIDSYKSAVEIDPTRIDGYKGLIESYFITEESDLIPIVYSEAVDYLGEADTDTLNELVVDVLSDMVEKEIKEKDFESANHIIELLEDVEPKEARDIKDESEKEYEEYISQLDDIAVGDTVVFGRYEQDGDFSNGVEPIEWIVLTSDDDGFLLLSKYGLENVYSLNLNYHIREDENGAIWEDCIARKWLNDEFYNNVFSEKERNRILRVTNDNHTWDNLINENADDSPTSDYVFLLSKFEVQDYIKTNEMIANYQCFATEYCFAEEGICGWLLRTRDREHYDDNRIRLLVTGYEDWIIPSSVVIRPAIWISR